jgi:hypothetical protein
MSSTTRRAVLIGAAALSATPASAIAAVNTADSKLACLCAEFDRADAQMRKAEANNQRILESIELPPRPVHEPPAEIAKLWAGITHGEFMQLSEDHPLRIWARDTEEERQAADRAWTAEHNRPLDDGGYTAGEAEWEERVSECDKIMKKILHTRAHSLAGLAVKVRAVENYGDASAGDYGNAWKSISADILALSGAA